MSEAQERSFKATDRRLKEVRRQGRLGRSQDLTAWVGLGAAALMLPTVVSRARQAAMAGFAGLGGVAQLLIVRQMGRRSASGIIPERRRNGAAFTFYESKRGSS